MESNMTKYRKLRHPPKKISAEQWRRKFTAVMEKINKKYHQVLRRLAK